VGAKTLAGLSDKKTYQMDYRNTREALHEAAFDVAEGADMLIVKPGLPYLDVISELSKKTYAPVLAYHVSGEYIMVKTAAEAGYMDERNAFMESCMAFKRAGARGIITYAALDLAKWLKES
jgi:porphobilinogen synthase